jgi:two-component system, OmpR family, alkaline phosphatase synthesis response regulator PhoP
MRLSSPALDINLRRERVRTRVLVVDDEPDLLELIYYNLTKAGYDVAGVLTGEEALTHVQASPPDLIVLDVLLPGLDGLEVCKALRRNPTTVGIPIVMLTARSEDADVVAGLELGADDYLTKPFSPRVLLARIKAVLRRRQDEADTETSVVYDDVVIHPGRYEVRVGDQLVDVTPTEFHILHLLARRPGWVFTRYQIVDAIRGEDAEVTERSVDVHVAAIRRKLGAYRDCIETLRGVGYRLKNV